MEENRKDQNQPEVEEQSSAQAVEEMQEEEQTRENVPEEQQAEPAEDSLKVEKEPRKKGSLRRALKSNKFKRGGMATLMTVVFIAIVVVVNILVGLLVDRFPSLNLDLTAKKINTLSDQALRVAGEVKNDTTIYLIGAEDRYRKDAIYASYNLKYSQVANLAEKLQEANSKIHVEFVDPDTDPSFISTYSAENLMTGDVMVQTEKRYRVLDLNDLFSRDQSTGNMYSKADSALASALELVNKDDVPVIAIATGHNELLTSDTLGSFRTLMEKQNFEVREFNILTDEIPEDTQIVMLPTPNTDYTTEELDKLRTYLDDETREQQLSLLVSFHARQGELPRLESFLEEWGVAVKQGMVAETDTSRMAAANPSYMLVDTSDDVELDGEYRNLVAAMSRPLELLFEGNGNVSARKLWVTSDTAYVYVDETEEEPETSQQTVATMSSQYVTIDGKNLRRSVLVFGSSFVFTDQFIEATAYGDSAYLADLLKFCTGTDGSSVSVYTETVETSVRDVAASQGTIVLLGLGVFTIGLPLVILIAGLVIFLKRRHL